MMSAAQRDAEIVKLALQGKRPAEIQRDLALPHLHTVHHAITAARQNGAEIPRFPPGPRQKPQKPPATIAVPADVMRSLGPASLERGISTPELVRKLLKVIAAEPDLTYAILDDHP